MNKRGFTLIELLVSFTLITIVSLSLFKTVLTIQKKSIKDLSYNQYLSFAASFSSNIQKDFTGDKIKSFSSCGNNCYEIVYETAGTKEIKIDRTNNTMSYGSINEKLPNNYIFYGDLILELNKIDGMPTDNYNSILTLKVPIKSNLTEEYSSIIYTYQYDDRQGEAPANVFHTLTIDPNEGTYAGETTNTTYYLMENTSQNLNIPMKQNYVFNGWTKTCSYCLVNNTYTMNAEDGTLTAQWLALASAYTYTGSSSVESDASGNWKIKFLTSGEFKPLVDMSIDAFLVGGGGGGAGNSGTEGAGGGGGGGYTGTWSSISLTVGTPYQITIGAGGGARSGKGSGGTGQTTTAFEKTVSGGTGGSNTGDYTWSANAGGSGGSGGGNSGHYDGGPQIAGGSGGTNGGNATPGGSGQGKTTREFGDSTGTLYAGGGGGAAERGDTTRGQGGAGGGGSGGGSVTAATSGTANTGGGGGGGPDNGSAGAGGSGIVIIRNKR